MPANQSRWLHLRTYMNEKFEVSRSFCCMKIELFFVFHLNINTIHLHYCMCCKVQWQMCTYTQWNEPTLLMEGHACFQCSTHFCTNMSDYTWYTVRSWSLTLITLSYQLLFSLAWWHQVSLCWEGVICSSRESRYVSFTQLICFIVCGNWNGDLIPRPSCLHCLIAYGMQNWNDDPVDMVTHMMSDRDAESRYVGGVHGDMKLQS